MKLSTTLMNIGAKINTVGSAIRNAGLRVYIKGRNMEEDKEKAKTGMFPNWCYEFWFVEDVAEGMIVECQLCKHQFLIKSGTEVQCPSCRFIISYPPGASW